MSIRRGGGEVGEALGGGGLRRERELFIAIVNGYVVHKDCSEGYPKERGQQRQVYPI